MGDVDLPLAAVREQVASAIDLVVHLARRSDGPARVVAVAEVEPECEATEPLRVRALAQGAKVIALPERAVRSAAVGPARDDGSTVEPRAHARAHRHERTERRRGLGRPSPSGGRATAPGAGCRAVPSTSHRSVRVRTVMTRARRRRQADLVDRDLPAWLDAGARSARAGASLRFALRDGALAVSASPIGAYLAPFVAALDRGRAGRGRARIASRAGHRGRRGRSFTGLSAWRSRSAGRRPGCSMPRRRRCTSAPRWRARCERCRRRPGRRPWS